MPRERPEYVRKVTSKGKLYFYLYRNGVYLEKLPPPNDPGFWRAYSDARAKFIDNDPAPRRHSSGSVGWLIEKYKRSSAFQSLAPTTQTSYQRELERLSPILAFAATDIKRRHINAIRDSLADKPRTQQLFGQVCSLLFTWGILERDLEMLNPAAKMRRSGKAVSHKAWPEEVRASFEASMPRRHVMTAYMIALYAGARRGDVCSIQRNHRIDGGIIIAGAKTDQEVWVLEHPSLTAYLDTLKPTFFLVADEHGKPVSRDRVSKDMKAHMDAIGCPGFTLHGLRHTAAANLAEAGCSEEMLRAVFGWRTSQMASHYTKRARQKTLSRAAITRLSNNKGGTQD